MPLPRPARAALFAPYLLLFYPLIAARRAASVFLRRGDWRTWITPQILLGGFLFPGDVDELRRLGVRAVVNVSAELVDPVAALRAADIDYHQVPCWDMRAPDLACCDDGVRFLAAHLARGERAYVHCASGVGRSVVLTACYLAVHEGEPVDEILARMKRLRPRVKLRAAQRAFIDQYVAWRRARVTSAAGSTAAG